MSSESDNTTSLHLEREVENDLPKKPPLWWLAAQAMLYVTGLGLLVWYVARTMQTDEFDAWEKLRSADWQYLAGMIGFTLGSLFLNGTTFWLIVRPIRDVGFWNMQRLNVVGNALNYLPLRPGLILRVAYHLRVDRLTALQIAAWFGAIAVILLMVTGVLVTAMLLRREVDVVWVLLVVVGLVVGGFLVYSLSGLGVVRKHGRGIDMMLRDHRVLWPAITLRLIDIGMYSGRLWCALAIVGLEAHSATYVILLALVALLAGLLPVRIGFREVLLGLAATAAASEGTLDDSIFALLALVESAGEAMVYVPLGAIAIFWYRRRWLNARRRTTS